MSRRATEPAQHEHPAVEAAQLLAEIATLYPTLVKSLPRATTSSTGRIGGTPESPIPFRESVSRMLGEVSHLAWFLGQRLAFETSGQYRVKTEDLPDLPDDRLAFIARNHVGHFTPDDDADSRAFVRDLESITKRCEAAAYPEGFGWVGVPNRSDELANRREPMPCAEPECDGHYRMRYGGELRWGITIVDPKTWPPLTCTTDRSHIVTGTELAQSVVWARANGTTHLTELRKWRAA